MKDLVSDVVAGLRAYPRVRPTAVAAADQVRLGQNENPYGPSPRAVEALRECLAGVHRYPEDSRPDLLAAIASRNGVGPEQVVLGAGVTELIELMVRTFLGPGEEALISAGSFVAYRLLLATAGAPFREVPLRADKAIDLDGLAAAVGPRTKLIFLPNPNNPTGSRFTAAELEAFVARLPADVVLFLDDAYVEYVAAADHPDSLAVMRRRPRTVVARTFSKVYGLAGLRIGYGIAERELVDHLEHVRRPFSVTRPAMAAALAALGDAEHVDRSVERTIASRTRLASALTELGFAVLPSHANFLTVDLGPAPRAAGLAEQLAARGILVRPLAGFGMPEHLRITIGTDPELDRLLGTLPEVS